MTYKFIACLEALLLLSIAFIILNACEAASMSMLLAATPAAAFAGFAAALAVSAAGLVYLYRHQDD